MIFEVGDYLHSGERRLRGRRRIFMNGWLLFPKCVCPLSLSFLKQNHPMHILYCKGACSWMIFCMVSAILYTILWKSNEHSFNQFSLQQPIKKKMQFPFQTTSAVVTHFTARFLKVPPELLSGSWKCSVPLRHLLLLFTCCVMFDHSEKLVQYHGELNKIVRVFSRIILHGLFL